MAVSLRRAFASTSFGRIPGLCRLGLSVKECTELETAACNAGPAEALARLVDHNRIRSDRAQATCVASLQEVWAGARGFAAAQAEYCSWRSAARSELRVARLRTLRERRELIQRMVAHPPTHPKLIHRGLYIWGGVGCGKSFLMDLFAASLGGDDDGPVVVRQHYHDFMYALHKRLHELRQIGAAREAVAIAAAEIRQGFATVLCLDEFQVTALADAVILKILFEALLANDVIVVVTSNRPPDKLYENGLNHMFYMPAFINLLESRISIHKLESSHDYRMFKMQQGGGPAKSAANFVVTSAEEAHGYFAECEVEGAAASLSVAWGRTMYCRCVHEGSAFFGFDDICGTPFSAEDYMALLEVQGIHTLVVTGIPRFGPELHNEARRFTNLVDCLYEHQCMLRCTALAPPQELMLGMTAMKFAKASPQSFEHCTAGMTDVRIAEIDLADTRLPEPNAYAKAATDPTNTNTVMGVMSAASASLEESGFAARRCVSRLYEMDTQEYYAAHVQKWKPT